MYYYPNNRRLFKKKDKICKTTPSLINWLIYIKWECAVHLSAGWIKNLLSKGIGGSVEESVIGKGLYKENTKTMTS